MFDELKKHCQSPLEERFLLACVNVGLRVEPQFLIGKIHADFAVMDKRIAIECDSKQFHSSIEAGANDTKRNGIYEKNEWSVLRLGGNAIMQDAEGIAMAIKYGKLYCGKVYAKMDDYSAVNDNLPFLPMEKEVKPSSFNHISSLLKHFPKVSDTF